MRMVKCVTTLVIGDTVSQRIVECDVMKLSSAVRGPLSRRFNAALRDAGKDVQVAASYTGQLAGPPYTIYSGELGGVNKRVMRRRGSYED